MGRVMVIRSKMASKKTLSLFVLCTFLGIFISSLFFESVSLVALQKWSKGTLDPNLVIFGSLTLFLVLLLLIKIEKFSPRNLGLVNLAQGVVIFTVIWLITQLFIIGTTVIQGQELQLNIL